ncbi:Malonyl-CoA decarboxylase, mitochondrial [Smittium mucronatum]|uniref:Malonyl-CoA decarboxylase, mitochondrial n=1 Tax=Smittium mucronatum TaxID=133383 RepID=A0A1R0GPT6_9FUNG|nr:Malonyl-CoA decarboxylase, mitochondrial [Smittium mucronatum]
MKKRLGPGRRCFGFFHRSAPLEPLVFVWDILDPNKLVLDETVQTADTAVFYSINSQPGVSGVDLGNFLIKRVVGEVQSEMPNIKNFVTLSPLPKFSFWLNSFLSSKVDLELEKSELDSIRSLGGNHLEWPIALKNVLTARGWISDPQKRSILKPILLKLAKIYLLDVKRPNSIYAYDPVANFHLRNGASIYSLNWLGDTSYNGVRSSYGIMCNYNYILDQIESNNEAYLKRGEIRFSRDVSSLY